MTTLGIRLKVARIKKQLSQVQVIDLLSKFGISITQSYLSKIENDVNEPDLAQLKSLAKIYDIDILELIYSEQELGELKKVE